MSVLVFISPVTDGWEILNGWIVYFRLCRSNIKVYSMDGNQINFIKINNSIDISKIKKGVYLISIDGLVLKYVYQ